MSAALRTVLGDTRKMVSHLRIADATNEVHRLHPLLPEQEPWMDALLHGRKYVLGLKPRQVGYTTLTLAYEFDKLVKTPHRKTVLSVVHDDDARDRLRVMLEVFVEHFPSEFGVEFERHNDARSTFAHNKAAFFRKVAGAKGKARSWTHNDLHATEMAHWPSATSASNRSDAGGSDEEMFSSAMATMHDPAGRVIVESTGNGPSGLFYDLWRQAASGDPKWSYVFVPWNTVARYQEIVSDEAALRADLDDEELALIRDHDLTLGQIAWRRTKLRTEAWNSLRFRREFPIVDTDPFLLTESGWFDQDAIGRLLRWCPDVDPENALTVWHEYEPDREYYMGVDTSGGVRKDWAVIHILRDDGLNVARWASNSSSPAATAAMVRLLGARYGAPLTLVEANRHGMTVIRKIETSPAVRLYKGPDGNDFWSTGGGKTEASQSKRRAMTHAREVIEANATICNCKRTLLELQTIVEKSNGKIEAAGEGHDDHAIAYILALWAARRGWTGRALESLNAEREEIRERLLPDLTQEEVRSQEDRLRTVARRFDAKRGR